MSHWLNPMTVKRNKPMRDYVVNRRQAEKFSVESWRAEHTAKEARVYLEIPNGEMGLARALGVILDRDLELPFCDPHNQVALGRWRPQPNPHAKAT